ncbi:MAG: hypothetical protein IT381_20500 [Deltaproteobacteria bacterium]|nr:hypothetical protein [Deltaproteobacteria bacterium]
MITPVRGMLPLIAPANDNAAPAPPPAAGAAKDIEQVLAPLHPAVRRWLEGPLTQHQDGEAVRGALTLLAQAGTYGKGSYAVVGALIGAGCVREGSWEDQAASGDPVRALAERQKSGADAPQEIETLARELTADGLCTSEEWVKKPELSNRRGVLGEVLRLQEIDQDANAAGLVKERGMLVLDQPPPLAAARTGGEAVRACGENGYNAGRLFRFEGTDGVIRYGLMQTEIDVLVAKKTALGLEPVRFENVKAGIGSASTARHQNALAKDVLARPSGVFVRVVDGRPKDVTHTIDRRPEVLAKLELVTVGPLEDPGYDAALPLTANDITTLAERLDDAQAA